MGGSRELKRLQGIGHGSSHVGTAATAGQIIGPTLPRVGYAAVICTEGIVLPVAVGLALGSAADGLMVPWVLILGS